MIQVRKNACKKAGKILGISDFIFLDFPDMRLDSIPHLEINIELEKIAPIYSNASEILLALNIIHVMNTKQSVISILKLL